MARFVGVAGKILLIGSLFAILGTAGAVDKSGLGLADATVQIGISLATGGIGGFMMKVGGCRHDG